MSSNTLEKATKRPVFGRMGVACSLVLLLSSGSALAANGSPSPPENASVTPPPSPAPAVGRVRDELGVYAEQARRERLVVNITTFAAGAALIPPGVILSQRSGPLAKTLGIGMTLGGSIPFLFVFSTLLPSKMERLRDEFDERRASGASEPELLRSLDEKWAGAARSAHNRRVVVGIVDLALGTAATGTGLFFLLSNRVGSMSRDAQYTVGYSLVGSGVPVAAFGIRSLVQKSLEETSWAAHRASQGMGPSAGGLTSKPRVGVAPLPGGAAAGVSFAF
jgi:hypothetical protein